MCIGVCTCMVCVCMCMCATTCMCVCMTFCQVCSSGDPNTLTEKVKDRLPAHSQEAAGPSNCALTSTHSSTPRRTLSKQTDEQFPRSLWYQTLDQSK